MDDNNLKIFTQSDGVYLEFGEIDPEQKPSRNDIVAFINSHGVLNVNFPELSEALKNITSHMQIKISENTELRQAPETAEIEVSTDKMEAFIVFREPVNNGPMLDESEIRKIIADASIVNINEVVLKTLSNLRVHNRKYVIARGIQPKHGVDGYLQYHFNNENLRPKPKIMEDGTVDFRQLGLLRLCAQGDVLVTSVEPKEGVDGQNVYGKPIAHVKGRLPQPIPAGKNVSLSDDGRHLIADVGGQLLIQNGRIHISPCLDIRGNIDNSTGNIEFNGQVVIRGNILTGFSVKAEGNIEIYGICEGATLISNSNIVLGLGAQGVGKAVINAAGDITAKFIENSKVEAGGNIIADSIINSTVHCSGDIILSGRKGLLVGGVVVAGNKISAKTIGSPMGTATVIEVGNNPAMVQKHKELSDEFAKVNKEYEKVDQAVTVLAAQLKKGTLNDEKKTLLIRMINAKKTLRERLNEIQAKIDDIAQFINSNMGTVSAGTMIHSGVKVTIGSVNTTVRDPIQHTTLYNNGLKVAIGVYRE